MLSWTCENFVSLFFFQDIGIKILTNAMVKKPVFCFPSVSYMRGEWFASVISSLIWYEYFISLYIPICRISTQGTTTSQRNFISALEFVEFVKFVNWTSRYNPQIFPWDVDLGSRSSPVCMLLYVDFPFFFSLCYWVNVLSSTVSLEWWPLIKQSQTPSLHGRLAHFVHHLLDSESPWILSSLPSSLSL